MNLPVRRLCIAVTILCICNHATATPILTVAATANPTTVTIGQPITVRVDLTGLAANDQLDSLATTVLYNGSLLGTPSVTVGPTLPNPLDNPLDLLISTDAGLADVAFLTFGTDAADHITSNGTFFTFQAIALAPGSANIAVNFAGATLFNAANPNDPTVLTVVAGAPISIVIVPEPSFLAVALVIVCAAAVSRLRQRDHRRERATPK
jgi:hypothetical protein